MSLRAITSLLRIRQWNKNLFVCAPLIFSGGLFKHAAFMQVFFGFLLFSIASSSIYIFNDIQDIECDRRHPLKKYRPLPTGEVAPRTAIIISGFLCLLSLTVSFFADSRFCSIVMIYLIINVLYSLFFKRVVIIDVMVIAAGFVLRVLAGAAIAHVTPSDWLIACTTLLALLLGFGKRRSEYALYPETGNRHRRVLKHYRPLLLDTLISAVTAATVISYVLYTFSDETVRHVGTSNLVWTVPLVLYGIYRYIHLVYREQGGGDPAEMVVKDKPLFLSIVLWGASCISLIYWTK